MSHADSAQELSQRTLQAAESTRAQRSTQVREVSEEESETVSTRVVANYNHMYAMTVQYYEVLQVYGLKPALPRPSAAYSFRCQLVHFNLDTVLQHRAAVGADNPQPRQSGADDRL